MSQSATRFGQRVRRARIASRLDVAPRAQRRAHRPAPVGELSARGRPASAGWRAAGPAARSGRSPASPRRARPPTSARSPSPSAARRPRRSASRRTRPPRPRPPRAAAAPRASTQRLRRPPLRRLRSGRALRPRSIGNSRLIMCSRNCGSRQNSRKTWAKTGRCSGRLDEAGLERRVEIPPVVEAHRLDRPDRVDHPAGPDRHPGARAAPGRNGRCCRRACRPSGLGSDVTPSRPSTGPSSALAWSRMRLASEPCIRAMSSWYLSSAPSVSAMTCGDSAMASRATRHFAQSMVSATPGFLNRSSWRSRWTKATTSRRQRLGRLGRAGPEDGELAVEVGVLDPMVEAAALQRVVDLAGAVRGEDDDRWLPRP